MRYFNTTGPVVGAVHYCVPPLERVNLRELRPLVREGRYFRKFVVECKVLHKSLERTIRDGLEQTTGYMDRCGAEEGHLVLFDRTDGKPWADKLFRREERTEDWAITVWGM